MANYNVDIEVAVKGQPKIKSLQRELTQLQNAVDKFNKPIDATPFVTQAKRQKAMLEELAKKQKELKVLEQETAAQFTRNMHARRSEMLRTVRLEIAERKKLEALAAERQRGLGQYAVAIGPQPDRLGMLRKKAQQERLKLSSQIAFNTKFELALASQLVGKDKERNLLQEKIKDIGQVLISNEQALAAQKQKSIAADKKVLDLQRQQRRQRIGGAISSGLIGGGFPLLFGQGGTAAAGGAIGGLAGGAIGGGFGFALSIIGTAAGQAVEEAERLNKSIVDLNSGLDGTATNASITSSEIRVLASELKLAKDETVELLAGFKGLGANTEQIKSLARVFGEDVSTAKSLATAEDLRDVGEVILGNVGKIGRERAQQLIDQLATKDAAVVQLALVTAIAKQEERRLVAQAGQVTFMDRLIAGLAMAGAGPEAAGFGQVITPESMAADRAAALQERLSGNRQQTIQDIQDAIKQFRDLETGLPDSTKAGSKVDPTIGLKKRLGILNSQIEAEQKVVGLSSEGAAIVRRKLAFEKRIAQIRETGKAERQKLTDLEDISLSKTIQTNAEKLATLQFEREIAVAVERSATASEKTLEPVQKKLDALRDRNAFEREYGELIMSGSTTAAAKQVIEAKKQVKEIDELVEKQLRSNEIQINILRVIAAQTFGTDAHTAAQEALNDALERENEIREKGKKAKGEVEGKKTPAQNIEEEMRRVKGELNDLLDPANQVILAAQAIGNAFSESFKGLITGSMSAQEALANLFQRTADHFADMAAQMIAKQIQMKILGIALSFFNPAASQGGSFAGVPNSTLDSVLPSTSSLADAAAATPLSFASGGYASGPTRALVGEGGQGEYIIPEGKMRESMARYSRGARGASVVPDSGVSGTSSEGGGAAVAAPIDVRYTVERINSVDYVTADQFQDGMRRAANQGAKQGEQQTLKRLQMSSSTRKRVGM